MHRITSRCTRIFDLKSKNEKETEGRKMLSVSLPKKVDEKFKEKGKKIEKRACNLREVVLYC